MRSPAKIEKEPQLCYKGMHLLGRLEHRTDCARQGFLAAPTAVFAPASGPAGERMIEENDVQKQVLPNRLTVVTERMPQVRSVTVGIWVKTGSRVERAELSGISHFIEHMLFKGTAHRTAEEIAREVDSVGGYLDAFTAKEMTAFTAKVMDEHLPRALDILSDLVLAPLLRAEDIHKEQGVILEEIKMEEDNPEYLVHEIFTQNFWRDHPLGKPIIGTRETVKRFDRAAVVDFFERCYRLEHILVAAAGHLDHQGFATLVEEKLGGLTGLRSAPKPNQEAAGPVDREVLRLGEVPGGVDDDLGLPPEAGADGEGG